MMDGTMSKFPDITIIDTYDIWIYSVWGAVKKIMKNTHIVFFHDLSENQLHFLRNG